MKIDMRKEQLNLAKKIIIKDELNKIERVAGCDRAYFDNKIISAIVVCDYKSLMPIERKAAIKKAEMNYMPGYLAYREMPAIMRAFEKLTNKVDLLMVEAHGITHPRRIGMASHLGLVLDMPTIGVAKKLLCGEIKEDKVVIDKEIRGELLKTREHSKPLIISPGHRISLKTAVEVVKKCIKVPHKLPEPLYFAHKHANDVRKS